MPRNVTVSPREHELLARIADAAKQQKSDCLELVNYRPDQAKQWQQLAALFLVLEGQVWDIATQGLLSRERQDG